jgi:hypothetical protein
VPLLRVTLMSMSIQKLITVEMLGEPTYEAIETQYIIGVGPNERCGFSVGCLAVPPRAWVGSQPNQYYFAVGVSYPLSVA